MRQLSNALAQQPAPLIIGHRGSSALAPENTLAAFSRALDDGAAGVELDVRLSRDGVPVVIHDASLTRTGLCQGVVARMTSAELEATKVGRWFNRKYPLLARPEYDQQTIPTLEQVFDLFTQPQSPPPVIYVEMKTEGAEDTFTALASSVAKLVQNHPHSKRVVVVSFDLRAIAEIKKLDRAITTGALFEPRRSALKTLRRHPIINAALDCGADEILLHRLMATRRLVELVAQNDLRPVVWTVDNRRWIMAHATIGIHAVISNKPGEMIAALG